ncbi:MAG: pentapeptide repeat-containing protein [Propionibacteriaceae bacterium]|jgi:uncharacterized protein YjbI with pentapeptide repeats|nr:pentapeptide repeat-containing protein [Propionibacteriaceae bacterium]
MDNNVHSRIDDYLDQVFGPYEDSPSAAELRIEIRHDLLERLNDLTEHGVADEVAYAQVISSIGDLDATIRELAGQDRAEGAAAAGDSTPATDETVPPEPEGPADRIPAGDTPGEAWTEPESAAQDPDDVPDYPDWATALADAFVSGLGTAHAQFVSALRQVDDAGTAHRADEWARRWERQAEDWSRRAGRASRRAERVANTWARRWDRTERRTRISYAATDLRGGDFHGQQIPDSRFVASSLRNTNFAGAGLAGSSFKSSDLRNADFTQADLTGADLNACSLRGAQFERANLSEASMSYSDLRGQQFTGTTLTGLRATYADLRDAVFSDCALDRANFTGSDLRGARFDGLALRDVRFDLANLSDATFRGTTLTNVSFHNVSRKVIAAIIFQDATLDRATYQSLRASGHDPQGARVVD